MKADDTDLSGIVLLLIVIALASCSSCERLQSIDKKLDVLIEQGKPVKESKP